MHIRFYTLDRSLVHNHLGMWSIDAGRTQSGKQVEMMFNGHPAQGVHPGLLPTTATVLVNEVKPGERDDYKIVVSNLVVHLRCSRDYWFVIDVMQRSTRHLNLQPPFQTLSVMEALAGLTLSTTMEFPDPSFTGLAPWVNQYEAYRSMQSGLILEQEVAESWLVEAWRQIKACDSKASKLVSSLRLRERNARRKASREIMQAAWPFTDLGRLLGAYGLS